MKTPIEALYSLQLLELGAEPEAPGNATEISRLRTLVPPPILAHYDRLMARGKKGVAVVRNTVCAECHMRLASGLNAELLRAEDIVICDNCGRYLIALPEEAPPPVAVEPETKPAVKKKGAKKRVKKSEAAAAL